MTDTYHANAEDSVILLVKDAQTFSIHEQYFHDQERSMLYAYCKAHAQSVYITGGDRRYIIDSHDFCPQCQNGEPPVIVTQAQPKNTLTQHWRTRRHKQTAQGIDLFLKSILAEDVT